MGGNTFDETTSLSKDDYNSTIDKLSHLESRFLLPYRLANKNNFSDIDLIVSETEDITDEISEILPVTETKIIPLDKDLEMYSKHLLTNEKIQIDLLRSYNSDSMEITRVFFSYGCANIFLKKFVSLIGRNFKLSYLGVMLNNNKFNIPNNVKYIRLNNTLRLIIDPEYIFSLIDLDYNRYKLGFNDEFELLEYFKTSRYYPLVIFNRASKFNHDYKRIESFRNLVDSKSVNII